MTIKKHTVTWRETVEYSVEIEAESEEEALDKVIRGDFIARTAQHIKASSKHSSFLELVDLASLKIEEKK